MFWGEKFTGEENFTLGEFSAVSMKNCGRRNVNKHREIKGSDNYFTLDILLKIYSLDKMRITSSESKDNLGRSGKGLITSLGLKAKARPHKYKKARYAIGNVSRIIFGYPPFITLTCPGRLIRPPPWNKSAIKFFQLGTLLIRSSP